VRYIDYYYGDQIKRYYFEILFSVGFAESEFQENVIQLTKFYDMPSQKLSTNNRIFHY
jgi:hypothetical protein